MKIANLRAITRDILPGSEDLTRIWPGRVRTLSVEFCTCKIGDKTVPSRSEDFKGTRTLTSEDVIRIPQYVVINLILR